MKKKTHKSLKRHFRFKNVRIYKMFVFRLYHLIFLPCLYFLLFQKEYWKLNIFLKTSFTQNSFIS